MLCSHQAAGPHCSEEVKSKLKAEGMFAISNFLVVTFFKLVEDELKFYVLYFILFRVVSFWPGDGVVEVQLSWECACLPCREP